MRVQVCRACLRLMNEEQFRYRLGRQVLSSNICAMCRTSQGGRVPCKTQDCPDCSLPSPRSNFLLSFRNRGPILKENCTECRCLARDPATLNEINNEIPYQALSEGLMAELGLLEEVQVVDSKPTLIGRIRQWATQHISRR